MSKKRAAAEAVEVAVDEDDRRELRSELRRELEELNREKNGLVSGDREARDKTRAKMTEHDELFKRVSHTREFVLDAEAGRLLGQIVASQAANVDVALASDSPPEFAARLRLALGEGEPADWAALAKRAARFRVGTCPGASFLLGPLPTVPVERKVRAARVAPDAVEKLKRVDEMEEADPSVVGLATARQVDDLHKKIKTMGRLPVWELVADPLSMAQTVEHMFHLSFLVKEGKAKIEPSANGPMVCPEKVTGEEENVERVQGIVRIDKHQLSSVIERYRISDPIMPHRAVPSPVAVAGPPKTPGSAVAPTQLVDSPAATTPFKRGKK